ncbi:DUF4147 domain-containing protein [Nitratireductor sp. CAU 1489]|uniref:DUF4147 domain-containing protein n=1 Tax=Nitratireductor arenosus TaxID=2682096 RepID=A0A844QK68_9HYPH|nr:glycerate kinase [Nitratireductor arenosus]MVA98069.1 DUF4147 domain-containing protein [Nitratireductor arenosus]
MTPPLADPRGFLAGLFATAVEAADPLAALRNHLPQRPAGRTVVVGAGKAASQMAAAFERLWDAELTGVVVARAGPVEACERIEVLQASHPVPDENGLAASARLLETVGGLTGDDLVVALISGGGSALLAAPAEGLTLADEIAVNRALLSSGAPISVMNVVRKHISRIKGGRLAAAAAPARVASLIVSDVPGDDPALVASGPTVPDSATAEEALAIVRDYRIELPERVLAHIRSAGSRAPSPTDPAFRDNVVEVVASARLSLDRAARAARAAGVETTILSDRIEGEAREIGRMHAALALERARQGSTDGRPVLLLSGGETTVTIGDGTYGKGGRNTEFLLSFALDIDGVENVHALSADTDGIDGSQDNAGAFCDGTTAARIRAAGGDPRRLLLAHDAWSAFDLAGDLFVPGPTGTNVNDFRAILVR